MKIGDKVRIKQSKVTEILKASLLGYRNLVGTITRIHHEKWPMPYEVIFDDGKLLYFDDGELEALRRN